MNEESNENGDPMQQANDSTLARELMTEGVQRLSVNAIAKKLRTGSRTIVRWMIEGVEVAGERVRLESVRWGGRAYVTTEPALARFLEKIGTAPPDAPAQADVPTIRTPKQRNDAAEQAMKTLGSV